MRKFFFACCILIMGSCAKKHVATVSVENTSPAKDTTLQKPALFYEVPVRTQPVQENSNTSENYYRKALIEIREMLEGERKLSFKQAVFITENAYFENNLSYDAFDKEIKKLVETCKTWAEANRQSLQYEQEDFENVLLNGAIFTLMTDTIWLTEEFPLHYPFSYDFEDIFGSEDWSKMFVTKLLAKKTGNCHSLPYLYKILADEIGTNAHLAFAPNHIYIKHKNKAIGMYNTELTSGEFPIDAWLMCSGYISTEAIINEICMDTLSAKESVAYTLVDLAQGYAKKFGKKDGRFMLESLDLALEYFPNSINALFIKAETQKHVVDVLMEKYGLSHPSELHYIPEIAEAFRKMEHTYGQIVRSGYKEMPRQMYLDWLVSLKKQDSYKNRKMNSIFKND